MRLGNLLLKLRGLSPLRYSATKCGHRTKQTGNITASGRTITTSMPKNSEGSVDYCLECIGKMAIQCAWCENPIFIGDPITLYTPRCEFQVPDHAVVHNKDPLQLVGCLGWNCAETGADRAGFWMPGEDGKGAVQRVPTAYEAILGAEEPSMVIVGDTGDMAEAMNPTLIPLEDKKTR
jgi:hypothetical protein